VSPEAQEDGIINWRYNLQAGGLFVAYSPGSAMLCPMSNICEHNQQSRQGPGQDAWNLA
jgi:hypothetical protein